MKVVNVAFHVSSRPLAGFQLFLATAVSCLLLQCLIVGLEHYLASSVLRFLASVVYLPVACLFEPLWPLIRLLFESAPEKAAWPFVLLMLLGMSLVSLLYAGALVGLVRLSERLGCPR